MNTLHQILLARDLVKLKDKLIKIQEQLEELQPKVDEITSYYRLFSDKTESFANLIDNYYIEAGHGIDVMEDSINAILDELEEGDSQ